MIVLLDEPEAEGIRARALESQKGLKPEVYCDTVKARKYDWVDANRAKVYELNKKYAPKYVASEKAKATRKAWREANKEKIQAYQRNYYLERRNEQRTD